ncbi:hypothetical protein KR51_00018610 [Rubidibacter lacunae KORDI 51-2]|uniref:DUF4352 domain-containing protein n=1 Tax=Rubidibacter lacunae KORDI 51-2 TaxID=582515 RepID=U5DM33_9CHRO|nr:hypothetical protein [Rubidibacter lacunae]ERN41634.1 hypothetical protein KR51_00018610 [Rubidibacter lacunae KORDI 51-2]
MRLTSTFAFTLLLLATALGLGIACGLQGYKMGFQALSGVRQPEQRPTKRLLDRQETVRSDRAMTVVSENEILERVAAMTASPKPAPAAPTATEVKSIAASDTSLKPDAITAQPVFPVSADAAGITLAVTGTERRGDTLFLTVQLTNTSDREVDFAYSTLDVRTSDGRALSAVTSGLPSTLPPTGETYSGTLEIPTLLLDDARAISLVLGSYPDRALLLELASVPVAR